MQVDPAVREQRLLEAVGLEVRRGADLGQALGREPRAEDVDLAALIMSSSTDGVEAPAVLDLVEVGQALPEVALEALEEHALALRVVLGEANGPLPTTCVEKSWP